MSRNRKRTYILNRNKKLYEFEDIKPLVIDHLSKVRRLKRSNNKTNMRETTVPLINFY